MTKYTSIEICAGAGGQALGLAQAGFQHVALVDNDADACATLRENGRRRGWKVVEASVFDFHAFEHDGVDLLAGGVPCPPFSKAGRQLGEKDERDLFPQALRLVSECHPRVVMLENVRGLLDPKFDAYRANLIAQFDQLGYTAEWRLLHASHFGVPQLRPRSICIAVRHDLVPYFEWPKPSKKAPPTVGAVLLGEMSRGGWSGAKAWAKKADRIAPTIVGGSKKHGGPDLGPTRAKKEWERLGVNAHTIAEAPPPRGYQEMPRLTVRMAALIQGFPSAWEFTGRKTTAYRQVGNAFPPPVAKAVGSSIAKALKAADAKQPPARAVRSMTTQRQLRLPIEAAS